VKHVLVIEDDAVNAAWLRKLLERRGGWQVTVTESPEELLRLARAAAIQVVVLDVSLHGSTWEGRPVSGVDLCRMLKADPATARIPVILATAHAMRGDEERLRAASGAEDYVSKPILDHDLFVGQVRRWLEAEAA
jgi:two-component system, cell cycle response regulator DivK